MGRKMRKVSGMDSKVKEERGWRVVDMDEKPILHAIPGGMTKADAERLSSQLVIETKVIQISAPDETESV